MNVGGSQGQATLLAVTDDGKVTELVDLGKALGDEMAMIIDYTASANARNEIVVRVQTRMGDSVGAKYLLVNLTSGEVWALCRDTPSHPDATLIGWAGRGTQLALQELDRGLSGKQAIVIDSATGKFSTISTILEGRNFRLVGWKSN